MNQHLVDASNPLSQIALVVWLVVFALWLYCLVVGKIPALITGFQAMAFLDLDRQKDPEAYWMVMAIGAGGLGGWVFL
ncbi:MAG: hypothetical protein V4735_00540 [Pseudomonadota bacterium]